jgi:hypothetical protein
MSNVILEFVCKLRQTQVEKGLLWFMRLHAEAIKNLNSNTLKFLGICFGQPEKVQRQRRRI